MCRDQIPGEHTASMLRIERGVPSLIVASDLVDRCQAMIRNRTPEELGRGLLI